MIIDIIFLIVAGYGFYLGFSRGIIQTIFTALSYFIGLIAAFKFSPSATQLLESLFSPHPLMFVAGFLLSFVLTMVLIRMLARGLEGILESVNINIINQIAGGALLAGIFVLIYSTILWFATASNLVSQAAREESRTYVYLEKYPEQAWKFGAFLWPTVVDFWDYSINVMDDLQQLSQEEQSVPETYDLPEEPEDELLY
ncbi:MAG: CvpA family protein [Saprospiraceae bacterium]|jgi:membrane protein required for colicin V production|nr:CvpA family protein [Saprospiraceae bacterium]MDP5000153.1 CvpA family protein [Saprospiraceae bacterium]